MSFQWNWRFSDVIIPTSPQRRRFKQPSCHKEGCLEESHVADDASACLRAWHLGGSGAVVEMAIRMYFLHKAFPDLVGPEYTLRAVNYILGTHPVSSTSYVAGVGVIGAARDPRNLQFSLKLLF